MVVLMKDSSTPQSAICMFMGGYAKRKAGKVFPAFRVQQTMCLVSLPTCGIVATHANHLDPRGGTPQRHVPSISLERAHPLRLRGDKHRRCVAVRADAALRRLASK